MRSKEFIVEYNRQVTAQSLGQKMLAAAKKDRSLQFAPSDEMRGSEQEISLDWLIEGIEESDPTPHKEYTQWLCRIYANGTTKYEDIESRAKPALTRYNQLKIKKILHPADKDIGQIKSLQDLETRVDRYPNVEEQVVDKGRAKEVYKDAQLRVILLEDEEAAKYYGQGTKWCTAAKENNMFNRYAKDGPIFVIIPTKTNHQGEKYQFHFESSQFMDDSDTPLDMIAMVKAYPQLRTIFKDEATNNAYIPLLPNGAAVIEQWPDIMKSVSSKIGKNFNILAIVKTIKSALRQNPINAVNTICSAIQEELVYDGRGVIDAVLHRITATNINNEDELDEEITHEVIHDWVAESNISSVLEELDQARVIDSMDITLEVCDILSRYIVKLVKQEIRIIIPTIR